MMIRDSDLLFGATLYMKKIVMDENQNKRENVKIK